jgi:Flp pilus assembly protein TadG
MRRKYFDILKRLFRKFPSHVGGNVAMLFALCSPIILLGVGGGIELARAYNASQELTQVADLACQYASRPSIVQYASTSSTGSTYVSKVTSFISTSLQNQNFPFTQTNGTPFSYTQNGSATVNLAATVPTIFAGLVGVNTIPIAATSNCYGSQSTIPQRVANGNSVFVVAESFENTSVCPSGYCFVKPNGTSGTISTPTTTASSVPSYTGTTSSVWYVTGYCVEIDGVGVIKSTVPDGNFSAELDCDNGSGTAGNSSISTNVYLPAGNYELRYNYASRVDYPDYDPAYICGSTASDVSWANDTNSSGGPVAGALRTNQINVYLDANTTGSQPTHLTIDGTEHLAGSNLIDMCVYSPNWIERSVKISVSTAGYYWLSFAADGQNDSFGGQIDNIRLCNGTCTGTVQDNFPSPWLSSSVLFEDTFESPSYISGATGSYNNNGNMGKSYGTSGASSGWPNQSASGWANAPTNQLPYWIAGCPQGTQCIELGWGTNSLISRPFLLDPGYYKVTYDYVSEVTFSGLNGVYCGATPSTANISYLSSRTGTGINRVIGVNHGTLTEDTNTVGVFMSHAQLASTPNATTTLGATVTYTNPDGSTSTTPTSPPNSISLTSYNSAQNNPLLDICGYASSLQSRTAYVLIQKPAYYWLTFAALGSSDSFGGQIDDVKVTAINSPYGGAPSGSVITIPVPTPSNGTSYTNGGAFSGFSIIADPLTP